MEENKVMFTRETMEQAMQLWEKTAFTLVDIRHALIRKNEGIHNYQTPACVLLFTCEGDSTIDFDDVSYQAQRFSLIYCKKGTKLSIRALGDWFEYYMILYKTKDPGFHRADYLQLLGKENLFYMNYGFIPRNPIYFLEQLRKMYERWIESGTLNRLYAKTAFYQLIYEAYAELSTEKVQALQPDMIEVIKKYLSEHFHESISIQALADAYHISASQLSRLFKAREKKSPKEFLTEIRLNAAVIYLCTTSATIREIALYCGFADEFSFTKIFKQNKKITPGEFRKKNTTQMHDFAIGNENLLLYNNKSSVSQDELKEGGIDMILRSKKGSALLAAALSSVMLLAGCQSNQVNEVETSKTENTEQVNTSVESNDSNDSNGETRVIHMEYGDVEIPANPKRVAIAFFQGDLLALGIKPVATSFNDDAVFEEELSDTVLIDAFELNPEAIMEVEPDLIIWNNPDDYEELSKIAPTIAMNFYSGMTYEERLHFFGEIFGCEEKAEQVISEFQVKIETAKETLTQKGLIDKTVILLENQQQGVLRAFGDHYGRGGEIIYQYLGLPATDRIQKEIMDKDDVSYIDIGYEMLNEYVGDYIFSDENIVELQNDEMWTSLPAVKEGRLIQTSSGMFWFSDITSMNAQLDFIVDSMVKTVE